MTDPSLVLLMLAGSLGLAGIALYRGIRIRQLKAELREVEP